MSLSLPKRGGGESCKNSASGSHCTDFTNFERTADLKSSSLPKFVKNSTSNTANPRILEENQASLSSRAAQSGVAIHSPNTQNLDSSVLAESTNPTPPPHKLCHLPFPNESFEIITMLAVLEHLHHPQAMLEEIARVLKPDGILLLTVPSHLAKPVLEFLAFRLKIVSEAEIADHKRYYNKRDLRELVASVPELTLTKHTYFQLGMNNFAIIHKRA
ncbi:class I SAM-dependent methyltransferase [Helicobacter canis]|uniref:Class I SAM-dependent methyltransferase n=1 Tax=Helicobacter canis TaxID=29419 RepID=A0A5M9QM55_9HELI|nr:class I SAM-dependent methyltransferase [Helicobacter canis]KAA8709813.1 class I SAM-dependent methyltransferase [Helicobacter canis]